MILENRQEHEQPLQPGGNQRQLTDLLVGVERIEEGPAAQVPEGGVQAQGDNAKKQYEEHAPALALVVRCQAMFRREAGDARGGPGRRGVRVVERIGHAAAR
jgi:hypothetical protein